MCIEECRCHNEAPTLLFVKTCLIPCISKHPTRSVRSEYSKLLYKNITTAYGHSKYFISVITNLHVF